MRSGFTIIRNGESLGYPYLESIQSLAPFVDEMVIAVGDSQDRTWEQLESLRSKIPCPLKLFSSPWDPQSLKGGLELSRQTNLALEACSYDVCFYLQGDEVLNDAESATILGDLQKFEADADVDCLAFQWRHFYGNYDHIVHSKAWYRREIRVVKRSRGLRSFGDAQGFRIWHDGQWIKSRAALSSAFVHHYGWVRPPEVMAKKSEALDRLWHGAKRDGTHAADDMFHPQFGLQKYPGLHPSVMQERIRRSGKYDPFKGRSVPLNKKYLRYWLSDVFEKLSGGIRLGEFKNYRSLKLYKSP